VIGGVLCEHTTWRWVFYINFPFCLLGFVLAIVFVRLNSNSLLTFSEKLRRTDWLGAVLFLGGTTTFLVGLSWGGIQYPWKSVQTIVPISVGVVAVVMFVVVQRWKAPRSMLPMGIFYCPSALAAFYCAIVNGFLVSPYTTTL
jgi:MFS family permease